MEKWKGFKAEHAEWSYANFSASELTAITGIPLPLQRAWRSRDQLPGGSGKSALFTSRDVAEIFVRYQLSLNGIAPGDSEQIGKAAAQVILYFALLSCDGACEVRGPAEDNARFLYCFEHEEGVAYEIAEKPEVKGFLWRGDGGALSLVPDVQRWMDEKRFAANFFLDLEVAALRFGELAGRPLVSIEMSPGSSERRFRRLTDGRID